MSWQILTGDCIEQMRQLEPESINAVVTDPPYELGFMGKSWDNSGIANSVEMWSEVLRVLKPGGHVLAFSGTRTYHRMVCAAEDAGFEIRDQIAWMFGSGFPKSLDVSKAIDKGAGAERQVTREASRDLDPGEHITFDQRSSSERERRDIPATAAAAWSGWGTALKPAFEPIVVARKPLIGTVAQNVLEHGTGAINIDATRVEFVDDNDLAAAAAAAAAAQRSTADQNANRTAYGEFNNGKGSLEPYLANMHKGRWPANVVLDPEAAAILDAQTGELVSGPESDRGHRRNADSEASRNAYGGFQGQEATGVLYGDRGGASRFFYCAKTSSAERNAGLDGFEIKRPDRDTGHTDGRQWDIPGSHSTPRANSHPTVKPVSLMRWLCRLITPPGGAILDPFNGSGSTGCAAVLEGFNYIGIEREPEYVEIAEARIKWWAEHPEGLDLADRLKEEKARAERESAGQESLFPEAA